MFRFKFYFIIAHFLKQIKILIEFDSAKIYIDFINGRISEIYTVSLWFSEINLALFERAA